MRIRTRTYSRTCSFGSVVVCVHVCKAIHIFSSTTGVYYLFPRRTSEKSARAWHSLTRRHFFSSTAKSSRYACLCSLPEFWDASLCESTHTSRYPLLTASLYASTRAHALRSYTLASLSFSTRVREVKPLSLSPSASPSFLSFFSFVLFVRLQRRAQTFTEQDFALGSYQLVLETNKQTSRK